MEPTIEPRVLTYEEFKKANEHFARIYELTHPQYHVARMIEEIRELQKEEVEVLRSLLQAVLASKT